VRIAYACSAWVVDDVTVFAVVPMKGIEVSKRRLSEVFSPKERSLLTLAMLEDVLRSLQASAVDEIVVIGGDDIVQRMADRFGVLYLTASQDGLNPAIKEAVAWCTKEQADWVLILPADVPLLRPVDVNRIIEFGVDASSVVLSPSHDGGTNALFQSIPALVDPHFGPSSFAVHAQEAQNKCLKVRFYGSLNILHDVDSAADLKKVIGIENNTLCREALEQIMISNKTAKKYLSSGKKPEVKAGLQASEPQEEQTKRIIP